MTFHPTDTCPACGNPRPWRHACACGDPGGMPRTLPETHPRWSKAERHLYAGQACRVLGEVDHAGNLLVEMMTGPLANERRWFAWEELAATGQDAAGDAPQATENGQSERTRTGQRGEVIHSADGEITDGQVEGDTAA
jgi:hypothetical protein